MRASRSLSHSTAVSIQTPDARHLEEAEMDDDTRLQGNRRDFLGLAATVAAAGLGTMVPGTTAVAAADGPNTDFTRWLD